MTTGPADYTRPEYEGHIRHNSLFTGGNARPAVQDGRADYTPVFLRGRRAVLFRAMPIDVCLLQATPPDGCGYLNLGSSVDCSLAAAECARRVIRGDQ